MSDIKILTIKVDDPVYQAWIKYEKALSIEVSRVGDLPDQNKPTKEEIFSAILQSFDSYGLLVNQLHIGDRDLEPQWELIARGNFANMQEIAQAYVSKHRRPAYIVQIEAGAGICDVPVLLEQYRPS